MEYIYYCVYIYIYNTHTYENIYMCISIRDGTIHIPPDSILGYDTIFTAILVFCFYTTLNIQMVTITKNTSQQTLLRFGLRHCCPDPQLVSEPVRQKESFTDGSACFRIAYALASQSPAHAHFSLCWKYKALTSPHHLLAKINRF